MRKETAGMAGAQVVIDLANAPSFADEAVLEFFEISGRNLLAAEPQRASGTMSRYPSSESTGATMAISAPRWPKRTDRGLRHSRAAPSLSG